jgi:hypothetical protein
VVLAVKNKFHNTFGNRNSLLKISCQKTKYLESTDILPENQLSEIMKKLHICSAYPRVSRTLIFAEA